MSALQTLVQGVCALSQALAVGGVGRAIVELLLTERGAGLCFHRGIGVVALQRSRRRESLRMQGGQSKTMRGVEGRPSLMKRDLGPGKLAHASPWHTDKLVAGWLQGMLP